MRMNRKTAIALVVGALAASAIAGLVIANVYVSRGYFHELRQVNAAKAAMKQRFALLTQRHTNKCSLASVDLNKIAVHERLQGACCEAMAYERYVQQVEGLRAYAAVHEIPADPYDVSVGLARRLTGYDRSISLSPVQRATYKQATKMADEHGPCCCRCWRWSAFEGQAKYLTTRRGYSSRRIAEVWSLEDGCGGGA